ncbi:MAG: hypothetical protein M1823_001018 [Watsoniomyces obsoletus]|nr:MAG: hypothetical protein M1823_001018 [Watsoniomyces obsoletus]
MDTRPPPNKNRLPLYIGLGAAGVVGYYLYSAGGSPKIAKTEAERDAARVSSSIKSELPGRGTVARKDAEDLGQRAGAKFDSTVDEAKQKIYGAEAKIERYGKEASQDLRKKIDETDKSVEQAAAKAKSGLSSWLTPGNK